ncbi:hypothetical protein LMG22037_03593 [Paraburkholderia phenoliruptrix]|uniref:Uncharacterized protein n=1 Tax=Paraburkholderia phenoliruptrix TaxID=252970 RepID=A0A6J5BEH2_9BURK|nr:hypothetical protein LMG22037_03593 [Paraburkholderia phenoliruptrix]
MEETGTNIHTRLVRRNNFLGENPTSWKFVAGWGKTTSWRARSGPRTPAAYEEAQ